MNSFADADHPVKVKSAKERSISLRAPMM